VTELRALRYVERQASGKRLYASILSGYFNIFDAFVAAALDASHKADGTYMTLNPVDGAYLARRSNRAEIVGQGESTPDRAIICRRWLPFDIDPKRPSGISATNEEKLLSWQCTQAVADWLKTQFQFPDPIMADAGNSYHLLFRIDLPNDDASRDLVKDCLEAVSLQFSDDKVDVDTSVFNAARIWKLYGTWARKGDDTADRPHRLSRILSVPEPLEIVSVDKLFALAGTLPQADEAEPARQSHHSNGVGFDLENFMSKHEISGRKGSWGQSEKWVLEACPFNSDHTNRSAVIVRFKDGKLGFVCHHNSCQGRGWRDLRDLFEPDQHQSSSRSEHAAGQSREAQNGRVEEVEAWADL
jgi:hypothetical protein